METAANRLHPKDRRTMGILAGGVGIVVLIAVVVGAIIPDREGWVGRVVSRSEARVCVEPRAGVEPSSVRRSACFDRGSERVGPAWSELDPGSCVSMRGDERSIEIDRMSEPDSC